MSCILFFLMSLLASSLSSWFCLFACSGILWVKNWGPLCWEPRAVKFSPFKAWSRSKYSYACFCNCQEGFYSSVWYCDNTHLPSPFTMFSKIVSPYFSFKCRKISGQWHWQIMKSRLQTWSKHCRLITCASAFYSQLVWLWVKMCCKWVTNKSWIILFQKLFSCLFSV